MTTTEPALLDDLLGRAAVALSRSTRGAPGRPDRPTDLGFTIEGGEPAPALLEKRTDELLFEVARLNCVAKTCELQGDWNTALWRLVDGVGVLRVLREREAEAHAAAAGDRCVDVDGDGCCDGCGVALAECSECHGRGYHRDTCQTESDE